MKRIQIKNSKTSPIKQQGWEKNKGLYFKSNKDAWVSFDSKTLNKCVLPKFIRKIPGGIHQKEGHLEMAMNWKCLWNFFTFEKFFTWAGRPWELGHTKSLCIFQLERLLITMKSMLKKKTFEFFTNGQIAHEN
jgi:hypothetical protein